MIDNKFKFPKDFLWGVSTSAYQIEGDTICDWSEWEKSKKRIEFLKKQGKNPEKFECKKACNSYYKYNEDIELVKNLNCGGYRIGIEWARIESEKDIFNNKEIEHYRQVLQGLKSKNVKTIVTLWHWTNPVWLSKNGGWENKEVVKRFEIYTQKIVNELGDLVDFWVTLNEPMIHVFNGYLIAKFPPAKKSIFKANTVFNNLVKAHKKAYQIIHKNDQDAQVSITQIVNYFESAKKYCILNKIIVKFLHYFWNHRLLKKIEKYLDYIGVDYYFHDRISIFPPFKVNENRKINDMGWEIYPEGIYFVLKYLQKFNKPIYILENGVADKNDKYRKDFIINHLKYVHKAIDEEVNVKGYFYWSLLDNFEWAEGFEPKFGLYKIGDNFKRIPRESAKVYSEICKNNSLPQD